MKINKIYNIKPGLSESDIWEADFKLLFEKFPQNIKSICYYGFTEIINNAIDHSEGTQFLVTINNSEESVGLIVWDNGVGIFKKIQRAFKLPDERLSMLELAKGKLTTDPAHHTGQGIFFTSHLFDKFAIMSNNLSFTSEISNGEIYSNLLQENPLLSDGNGTVVVMMINPNSKRSTKEIFDKFAPPTDDNDFDFNQTIVPVRLAQYSDEELISRSQAKRLVARLESFAHIIFDFAGIKEIGPAFADEVFRVFARQHPDLIIEYANANSAVERMIKGAQTAYRP